MRNQCGLAMALFAGEPEGPSPVRLSVLCPLSFRVRVLAGGDAFDGDLGMTMISFSFFSTRRDLVAKLL
jgi:hypothetical protein